MTTVERFDDASGTWVSIDKYGSFEIENGVSDVLVAPEATLQLQRTADVSAGTRIRIREGDTDTFEGNVVRTKPRSNGPMQVDAEHDAHGLFDEEVSLSVSGTDEDVLAAALSQASGTWTLAYAGTATSLGDTYEADGRSVKRVFRDMVDRVGRVWWVDVDHTIHVAPLGDGGLLASVDTSTDAASVSAYVPDDIDTVVNDVTVVGTGGEKVEGSASDAASIDEYGSHPARVNVEYIRSASEANDYASELLTPEPDATATIRVGASVADVATPVVNQELDVTDEQGTGMDERLPIEKQVVTQGSAELDLGAGAGVNVATFNRREKSKADVTEEGSVYGNDRIGDNAVDSNELVDTAVIESKLADLSVSLEKVRDGAIDTVKITDDAIEAPKIRGGEVTAAKLDTGLARAERLLAGEIEAIDIRAGTITANEVDTLFLETGTLAIGTDADDPLTFETETIGSTEAVRIDPAGITTLGSSDSRFLRAHVVDSYHDEVFVSGIVRADSSTADIGTSSNEFRAMYTETLTASNFVDTDSLSSSTGTVFNDFNADRVLPVGGDGSGFVGEAGNAWSSMRAGAFVEDSPEPADAETARLDELTESDWYAPPRYVAEEQRDRDTPDDDHGVELGHMSNYLFEVAKEQQHVIDGLAERISELEDAVEMDPNA